MMTYRNERVTIEFSRTRRANVDDFYRALDDLEWRQFDHMRQAVKTLRDHYATMHDVITRNWQLIRHPRSVDNMPPVSYTHLTLPTIYSV